MDINRKTPKDISNEWDDIRPYRDDEISDAMQRIASDENFPAVMNFIYEGKDIEKRINEFRSFKTVSQFQVGFMFDAINAIVRKTTDGFTYDGFENLEPGKGYLFVSNHRDILLDAALLEQQMQFLDLFGHLTVREREFRFVIGEGFQVPIAAKRVLKHAYKVLFYHRFWYFFLRLQRNNFFLKNVCRRNTKKVYFCRRFLGVVYRQSQIKPKWRNR